MPGRWCPIAKKAVTINEEKFVAERKELDKDKEEEEQIKDQTDAADEIFEPNYYNDELIDITLDYVRLLAENKIAKR